MTTFPTPVPSQPPVLSTCTGMPQSITQPKEENVKKLRREMGFDFNKPYGRDGDR